MTEVGVIPEDWEVKKLGDLGIFLKGRGIKKDECLTGSLPCIRYGEIYTKYNYCIKEIYSYISHCYSTLSPVPYTLSYLRTRRCCKPEQ